MLRILRSAASRNVNAGNNDFVVLNILISKQVEGINVNAGNNEFVVLKILISILTCCTH